RGTLGVVAARVALDGAAAGHLLEIRIAQLRAFLRRRRQNDVVGVRGFLQDLDVDALRDRGTQLLLHQAARIGHQLLVVLRILLRLFNDLVPQLATSPGSGRHDTKSPIEFSTLRGPLDIDERGELPISGATAMPTRDQPELAEISKKLRVAR